MEAIDRFRWFNRLYTQRIGVMDESFLQSPFTVAEARVLYELAEREPVTAAQVAASLGLDRGYLSRMLADFTKRKLIKKTPSKEDKRQAFIELSEKGRAQFAVLDSTARSRMSRFLEGFSPHARERLLHSMTQLGSLLEGKGSRAPVLFRPPKNGDLGWIIHRHGAGIAEEFGFDQRFEALAARIIGDFAKNYDPRFDQCWVAEHDNEVVGSLFLIKENETTGRLRLLYVEPHMRGQKVGQRLMDKAVRHARKVGYSKLVLFTNHQQHTAHYIYEKLGFTLVSEAPHQLFGENQIGQEWELAL